LFFHHADANGGKTVKPVATTAGQTAGGDASDDFCLIANADLAQLNACFEYFGEVFDVASEIHPLLRCEVQENLFSVQGVLHVDEFHVQLVFS